MDTVNTTPLSKICGINPRFGKNSLQENTVVSFVPMAAVDETVGRIVLKEERCLKSIPASLTPFKDNDILFAKITPCMENGKVAIARNLKNGYGFGSTEFHVLRPNLNVVISEWVYYFLRRETLRKAAERSMTGSAGQKRVPKQFFDRVHIPVPPISKQKEAIAILADVETALEKRREAIRLLDDFLKSTFLEMFGEPMRNSKKLKAVKCGDIALHVSSGSTPLGGEATYLDKGIIFIRSQNVLMNHLDLSDVAYISEDVHNQMKRTWVKNGDVLLNITGASIGRIACYKGEDDTANVNQHVCIIRPERKKVLPEYLSFLMSMPNYQQRILSRNSGATRQAFNFQQIRDFDVPLADIQDQSKFASVVEQTEKLKQQMKSSETEIQNLFGAVMQRAFSGSLTEEG